MENTQTFLHSGQLGDGDGDGDGDGEGDGVGDDVGDGVGDGKSPLVMIVVMVMMLKTPDWCMVTQFQGSLESW